MNSSVRHILVKDMVRFRLHLALWCGLLVGRVMCAEWAGERQYSALEASAMMWPVAVFLFGVTLVVRVLAEDSPLKEAAFWRTRPISGGQMLAAKVIFIAGWTVLLPALVIAAATMYHGFTAGEFLAVVAGQVVLHGFIGVVFLTASAFFQRVFPSVICFLLFGVFTQLAAGRWGATETVATFERASLVATRTVLASGFFLAACGLATWSVYRSRRRGMAAVVLVARLVAMKLMASLWPWDGLGWVAALTKKDPVADSRSVVELAQANSSGLRNVNGVDYHEFSAALKESSLLPGEIAWPFRVEGEVVWPDGTVSLQNREEALAPAYDFTAALHSIGIEGVPHMRYARGAETTIIVAQLRDAEFEKLRRTPAEWRGRIAFLVGRIDVKTRIPLMTGTRMDGGAYRLAVTNVVVERDALKVKLIERRADTRESVVRLPQRYALINARRKEAILATGAGGVRSMNGGLFEYSREEMQFSALSGPSKLTPEEWADWLNDAELVQFQFREERRVSTAETTMPLTYLP